MKYFIKIFFLIIFVNIFKSINGASVFGLQFVRETIQNNFAGIPLVHEHTEFEFDPDISKKRRAQYYDLHGFRGDKFIQRIGLGVDGKFMERLNEQEVRDYGKTNGLSYGEEYNLLSGRKYEIHAKK